jgi:hypothetical protein
VLSDTLVRSRIGIIVLGVVGAVLGVLLPLVLGWDLGLDWEEWDLGLGAMLVGVRGREAVLVGW